MDNAPLYQAADEKVFYQNPAFAEKEICNEIGSIFFNMYGR